MSNQKIEPWRRVWRQGLRDQFSTESLLSLRQALASDDHRLLRGGATTPPMGATLTDLPCEQACAIAYTGWLGDRNRPVSWVQAYYEAICAEADRRLNHADEHRWFTNWFDEAPWPVVRTQLLSEVDLALLARGAEVTAA